MKPGIHPKNYRHVVFQDISCDLIFLTRSTLDSKENVKWKDGKEYPLIKVDISNESHPFFTGKTRMLDTEGRVDKFKKKYAKR
ncbi:MAG: type B 50S ribosomal protein L31 [Bdellovibrionota bacterium]